MIGIAHAAVLDTSGVVSGDLFRFRSVGAVRLSPDETRIAYTVVNRDMPGRPYSQVWVMDVATEKSSRFGGPKGESSIPEWSPDGQWSAYFGSEGDKTGLMIARPDGSGAMLVASVLGTNSPTAFFRGKAIAWSPDSKKVAFVSAIPGPEAEAANGDPMVITRYIYKPHGGEGFTRFNDNRRLHIFVVDLATKRAQQLTQGIYDEHSIDWSPNGEEILFVSNREPNADEFFNYDLFALRTADGSIRRLTATENSEFVPIWSPNGQTIAYLGGKRGLTVRESNMENWHVWLIDADGSNRRELGSMLDNSQGEPRWAPDGRAVYFTVGERGNTHLYRLPVSGGQPELVVNDLGAVGSWCAGKNGTLVYSFHSPGDFPELYLKKGKEVRRLTDLNAKVLAGRQIAETEPFTFLSNDNKYEVEAFLTKPLGMTANSKHPLIVDIHGGPHGMKGPEYYFNAQVYAARGWATLRVNYRASKGYGQKFADAIWGDQDGNEAKDVQYGVSAAVRRYLWIDRERMGVEGTSYGGQLSMWMVTQTNQFKAAIAGAGICNLISFNYMPYYNSAYLQNEMGQLPHQGDLMNLLWERSALKHVAHVHTPVMLWHGENDADVAIAETEQFYIALKDVGVETVMLRYPREGHGLAETRHIIDLLNRSVAWYERHFQRSNAAAITNVQP